MVALTNKWKRSTSIGFILTVFLSAVDCRRSNATAEPSIEFSRVPPASDGAERLVTIEGRVRGARPGQKIVLFALSGVWWVQPFIEHPFTTIQKDSTWKSLTHPGAAYAALLVDGPYTPPYTANALPEKGGPILAVRTVPGGPSPPLQRLEFSGYQWEIVQTAGPSNGANDLHNTWVDHNGFLHLRMTRQRDRWVSSEVKLSRSLGYGSYRFVVGDISHLEPAAVFAMFTFDYQGPSREMDIEVSHWGEPQDKNAQFVVQPYVVPANTVRFDAPAGRLTYWVDWGPGRVDFKTVRGSLSTTTADVVSEHVFTSGVPTAGNERIHMNLWPYESWHFPLQHEDEIVVEKFEFLP